MRTYLIKSDDGLVYAFEIENVYISLREIARILKSVTYVSGIRIRKLFSSPAEARVYFQYMKRDFVVWEPYADSSRYWIGPREDMGDIIDMSEIEMSFKDHRVPLFRKFVGDLISLNFRSLLNHEK